jgi:Transcriptional Coactivator p15 (PC4)
MPCCACDCWEAQNCRLRVKGSYQKTVQLSTASFSFFLVILVLVLVQVYEKDGKKLPGKKGISLTPEQYEVLKKAVTGGHIDKEIKKLEKKGK